MTKSPSKTPNGSLSHNPPARLPDTESQPDTGQTLVGPLPRETARQGRITVRITRHSSRLLDIDNFAGGCKPLIDQLRYAKLIPDDDPASVDLQFAQEKVAQKFEMTTIEILQQKQPITNL
jgi:hypothetical protein